MEKQNYAKLPSSMKKTKKYWPTRSINRETNMNSNSNSKWVIILSGGEGERMRPFIRQWLGFDRPKQYCAFMGAKTMFEHTMDRALAITKPENIVTVIGNGHRQYLRQQGREFPGKVLQQPYNRGTASGVFIAIAHIYSINPDATVLVLPSDHFIHPVDLFLVKARQMIDSVKHNPDRLVLMGATADRPETDYGWIEPDWSDSEYYPNSRGPIPVLNFHEKPNQKSAAGLLQKGCLWNTLIFAGKIQTFWYLGWKLVPEMIKRFDLLRSAFEINGDNLVEKVNEKIALEHIYQDMRVRDFSRDILEKASRNISVFHLDTVEWCDWGRPERLLASLRSIRKCQDVFKEKLANENELLLV